MSALEIVGSGGETPQQNGEPPQAPPLPPGGKLCPIMTKAVLVPIPSPQRFAPAGQMAVEMQSQILEVLCQRDRCEAWEPTLNYNRGGCGLKETSKCLNP